MSDIDEEMEVVDPDEDEDEMAEEQVDDTSKDGEAKKVYLPGQPLEDGEELVCDPSAYIMYHQAQTSSPCLSFDILHDSLGDNRETFPLSAYLVAGTQAPKSHVNHIIVMKLSNLYKTNTDDKEEDNDESEEEDEDKHPKMHGALIKHQGCVNRIRVRIPSFSELLGVLKY